MRSLKFIHRCIQLGRLGLPAAMPNPSVGCVIEYNGKIIGEGFTSTYGGNHAEVNAINSVSNKDLLKESTLYVSLEPCSHYGKTPPCSSLIIKHKIKKVVIASLDPNPLVSGKGIKQLTDNNIDVEHVVVSTEYIHNTNKRFNTFHNNQRPYIILKWAQTSNGYFSKRDQQFWITNKYSKCLAHKWRSKEQSILVGSNTIRVDNPELSVRLWEGFSPLRIVIFKNPPVNRNYHVFNKKEKTLIFNSSKSEVDNNTEWVKLDFNTNILPRMMEELFRRNIQSVLVEGGRETLQTFVDNKLWDEARVLIGEKMLSDGIASPNLNDAQLVSTSKIFGDSLETYIPAR